MRIVAKGERKDGDQAATQPSRLMKSAWVIVREGTRQSAEVLAVVSARESPEAMRDRLEWLYAVLHCGPETNMDAARYRKPSVPYEAKFSTTNSGIPHQAVVFCGHNPWLVAQLSRNLSLRWNGDEAVLTWNTPERLVCNPDRPYEIIEKVFGIVRQARVSLPWLESRQP
jgi:hypothetical protein